MCSLRVLQVPPTVKNMHIRLFGDSKWSVGVNVSVNGFVSMWPYDEMVTCPGCHSAFILLQLG